VSAVRETGRGGSGVRRVLGNVFLVLGWVFLGAAIVVTLFLLALAGGDGSEDLVVTDLVEEWLLFALPPGAVGLLLFSVARRLDG
jgi:TRAP-type C4-dicarboxylate transport system permease small subunit